MGPRPGGGAYPGLAPADGNDPASPRPSVGRQMPGRMGFGRPWACWPQVPPAASAGQEGSSPWAQAWDCAVAEFSLGGDARGGELCGAAGPGAQGGVGWGGPAGVS